MRALIVGDIHLADKPPSMRTDSYADDIMDKLEQTVVIANDSNLDAVVWVGDVFHVKTPSRTSHRLVQRVMELGARYEVPWLIVPGNHDIQHDRLDTLSSQPLGTLFESGKAIPLVGSAPHNLQIFGIPYLQDWSREFAQAMKMVYAAQPELVVIHGPVMPPGKSVPYDYIDAADISRMLPDQYKSLAFYYGHIHECHGAYTVDQHVFCNQGAISRGSLHESDLSREPAVTIFDSEQSYQMKFERVDIFARPIAEVMRLSEVQDENIRVERLDEFLGKIGETTLDRISLELVQHHLQDLELRPRTKQMIAECLEVATS